MPSDPEFAAALAKDLLALGVRPAGLLKVHSSMRAFRRASPAGPEDVIRGLLAALGPKGTLLMPALTSERVTPDRPVFDIRRTPGNLGNIPETFRLRPGTRRSLHPTHSACAAGPLARELTEFHAADTTPCGPHTPFRALAGRGGRILFLGCGWEADTFLQAVEETAAPPYLSDPPIAYRLILPDGSERTKTHTPHNFRGRRRRCDRAAGILGPADLARGTAGGAVGGGAEGAGAGSALLRGGDGRGLDPPDSILARRRRGFQTDTPPRQPRNPVLLESPQIKAHGR